LREKCDPLSQVAARGAAYRGTGHGSVARSRSPRVRPKKKGDPNPGPPFFDYALSLLLVAEHAGRLRLTDEAHRHLLIPDCQTHVEDDREVVAVAGTSRGTGVEVEADADGITERGEVHRTVGRLRSGAIVCEDEVRADVDARIRLVPAQPVVHVNVDVLA